MSSTPTPESSGRLDGAGLRAAVGRHWRYHGPCGRVAWAVATGPDTGEAQVEVAPVFQEVYGGEEDGTKVWTGFRFDLSGFAAEPGVEVREAGAVSYCAGCSPTPTLAVRGAYHGHPFALRLHLEPAPGGEPVEVIDAINHTTRPIGREGA